MSSSRERRSWLDSTNLLDRPDGQIKRRSNVVGIVPNEVDPRRMVVEVLAEQTTEWSRRCAKCMSRSARPKGGDDALLGC